MSLPLPRQREERDSYPLIKDNIFRELGLERTSTSKGVEVFYSVRSDNFSKSE